MPQWDDALGNFPSHKECCAVQGFREGGCSVVFPNRAGKWLCISGTNYQKSHGYTDRLCDLVFAWNRNDSSLAAAALELKGGGLGVNEVVKQIQHGADLIDDLLGSLPCTFLPVLIHRPLRTIQHRELQRKRVRFRGERFAIALVKDRGRILDLPW